MAEIKPFRALKYQPSKSGPLEEVTCDPYDVVSEDKRKFYLDRNPYNLIRLELPKEDAPYQTAAALLKEWISSGILKKDPMDAIYIYEEEFSVGKSVKKVKGIICRVRLEEFSKGIIIPHEETLGKAKEDRFCLMKETACNFSPIYSLYSDPAHITRTQLDALSDQQPDIEMTDDALVTHRLWTITDKPVINKLCQQFRNRKLYIADGHHRYETALRYRDDNRTNGTSPLNGADESIMMMLVDMENEGLVVFPTHRLIHGLKEFNASDVLSKCIPYFTLTDQKGASSIEPTLASYYEKGEKAFAFYQGDGNWTLMVQKDKNTLKKLFPEKSDAVCTLDVTILHTLILNRIFGIDEENMKNQTNLHYTRSFQEAISSVDSGESQCAFLLNPTKVSEILDVAATGEKMPQKSTYFYPKLLTGLVINDLTE